MTKNRGRRSDAIIATLEHLEVTAAPSLFPDHDHPEYQTTAVSTDLSCPICLAVLERPLQVACGNIICCDCCHKWIQSCSTCPAPCPCCYNHHLDITTIRPPPPVVVSLVSSLLVICSRGCGRLVRADNYIKHLDSKCTVTSGLSFSNYPPRCVVQARSDSTNTNREEGSGASSSAAPQRQPAASVDGSHSWSG